MQFIDEAKIYIKAGNGGNGCVSFRREKYEDMGGPNGGNGGKGGSIIFKSSIHLNTLLNYRFKQHFKSQNGENGKGSHKTGKGGENLILTLPIGTQIFNEDGLLLYDFTKNDEEFEILIGGNGGTGNAAFKNSINQSPTTKSYGEIGEELNIMLKLKILSDAGLIGLPNSGKSTFLSRSTNAKPKIADYPFTTLTPGLGMVRIGEEEFVLADIPGLIEGAHLGHGLGDKFLKHIERCRVLIHMIDISDENFCENYLTIRNELESYSNLLKDKKEIICLNKCDILDEAEVNERCAKLKNFIINTKNINSSKPDESFDIFLISAYQKQGITSVLKSVLKNLQQEE